MKYTVVTKGNFFFNCSWVILEAKTACSAAVKKAKTTRGCMVQEAEATCTKAISKVEAQRALQAESFQRGHGSIMQDLEEQVIQEESRSQAYFLSTFKSPCTTAHQSLKALWLLPTTSYWGKHLHHLHLPCHRDLPLWKDTSLLLPLPHQCPSSLIGPKDGTPHQILWRVCLWAEPPQRLPQWDFPAPRGERSLPGSEHSSQAAPRHLAGTLTL